MRATHSTGLRGRPQGLARVGFYKVPAPYTCHSERSEESAHCSPRFFAALRMTGTAPGFLQKTYPRGCPGGSGRQILIKTGHVILSAAKNLHIAHRDSSLRSE